MSIQEALITMFTDDPVNWLKWAIVFAVLIGGYAIAVPLYKKVSHGVSFCGAVRPVFWCFFTFT